MALAVTMAVAVVEAAVLHRRPMADAGLTAVARRAAKLTTEEVIYFPSPSHSPPVGRFHALPSLQCRVHPTTAGGASPDPNAVHNPYGGEGTGWAMNAKRTDAVIIPYGSGTCASPLNDVFQLAVAANFDQMALKWNISRDVEMPPREADAGGAFMWVGNAFDARMSWRAMLGSVSEGRLRSHFFRKLDCAERPTQSALVCEDEIVRLLSLHRNQVAGGMQRQRGLYDVLTVERATDGVVIDSDGKVVAAVDRVSNAAGIGRSRHVAVLLYETRNGDKRPVLAGEAAPLSLGRAVLADPSWLGRSRGLELTASVELEVGRGENTEERVTWSLSPGTPTSNSSAWLQEVAKIMCTAPMSSFVVDGGYCDGVKERLSADQRLPLLAGGSPVLAAQGLSGGHFADWSETRLAWHIASSNESVTPAPCESLANDTPALQPNWLLGRGDREIHATSTAERELASNLSLCAFHGTRWDLTFANMEVDGVALTSRLSQEFRRDIFGVDPPADPASDASLLLAVLVVVPEAAVIVQLLLRRHVPPLLRPRLRPRPRWYWREGASLAVAIAAGAVALVGVGFVDRQEQLGNAWRAAAVRHSRRIPANQSEHLTSSSVDYSGRIVYDSETLIVIARTGYRPGLTRWLLIGSIVAFAMLTVGVLLRSAVAAWQLKRLDGDAAADSRISAAEQWPSPRMRHLDGTGEEGAAADGRGGGGRGRSPPQRGGAGGSGGWTGGWGAAEQATADQSG